MVMVIKWLFVWVHKKMFLATTPYLFDISDETWKEVGMLNIENNALITFFMQKAVGQFHREITVLQKYVFGHNSTAKAETIEEDTVTIFHNLSDTELNSFYCI